MKKTFTLIAVMLLILLVMPAPAQAANIPANEAAIYYNGERQGVNAWLILLLITVHRKEKCACIMIKIFMCLI